MCTHIDEYLRLQTNNIAYETILNYVVFPKCEKGFTYKASLPCALCRRLDVQVERSNLRPICLLACGHCIHFACLTNNHIQEHVKAHPDHHISVCLERGELYCSACNDFVYSDQPDRSNALASSQYMSQFGLSQHSWRPSFKELDFIPHLRSVVSAHAASGQRRTRGLVNMGNTCFLNVVVQALTHTPILRDYFLADIHRCDNPVRSRNCLACEMIRITQEIYRPVLSPYVPCNLLHTIWLHASHLAGYEQRDAHEFLITLLTLLHTHLIAEQIAPQEESAGDPKRRKVRSLDEKASRSDSPVSSASTSSATNTYCPLAVAGPASPLNAAHPTGETSSASSLEGNLEAYPSGDGLNSQIHTCSDNCDCIVHQVFFGDLESVVSYQGCDHRSSKVDPFLDLSLDVAQHGTASLDDCLTSYFRPEKIDGLYFCSRCEVRRPAVKQFSLLHLPNVLCFYLKRCHRDTKITTSISFPIELDIAPFLAQLYRSTSPWQNKYSLFAVVNHSGQTNSGHYTAYIRSGPGMWCLCDDQKILSVNVDRVLSTDAYVLLYHKNLLAIHS